MSQTSLETMDRRLLAVIIFTCIVAGTTQGLLLPLLSYLLEIKGVSSSINGLNSAALYIGMMGTSLLIENPTRRFGYKPIILAGAITVCVTLILYPVWDNMYFWVVLRLFTGAGVTALHYAAQLWIMSSTPAHLRGRYISMYGMAYGAGFGIGPLGVGLLPLGLFVPFICATVLFSASIILTSRVKNDRPVREESEAGVGKRYWYTLRLALLALIPASLYGFMEAMLTSNFTIFGERTGLTPEWVGLCLSVFVGASLVTQIPLGTMGDRYGRRRVLMTVMSIGGVLFMIMPTFTSNPTILLALFAIAGALVGSISSLGMGYGVDILPKHLLPTLGVMSSLGFGFASVAGPNIGGFSIQYISPDSMFYILGGVFIAYVVLASIYKPKMMKESQTVVTNVSSGL